MALTYIAYTGLVKHKDIGYIRNMSSPTKYPYKRIIQLDEERRRAIREYRFDRELLSDAEAIRELLDVGLAAKRERGESKRAVRR